jgi:pimeloyl-ACP methyl ester carboxylesterase
MRKIFLLLCAGFFFTANIFAEWSPDKLLPGEEVITLQTKDKLSIGGSVYYPAEYTQNQSNSKKYPAVILLHSWLRDRSDWTPFIPALQQAGYVVIAIDLRNHGTSDNKKYWHRADYNHMSKMIFEASAAYDYLNSKEFVDKAKIYTMGVSIGAIIAVKLCYAINTNYRHKPLAGAVLVSPAENYFNVPIDNTINFCVTTPFLFVMDKTDPRPNDNSIYVSGNVVFNAFHGQKAKIEFNGTGHGNKMIATERFTNEVLAWLKTH